MWRLLLFGPGDTLRAYGPPKHKKLASLELNEKPEAAVSRFVVVANLRACSNGRPEDDEARRAKLGNVPVVYLLVRMFIVDNL